MGTATVAGADLLSRKYDLWPLRVDMADQGLSRALRDSRRTPTAFSRVYAAKAQDMLLFFARRTFDVESARDLMAETFAEAFEHRRQFRGTTDAEAEGWLYGIARHQLSRYTRKGVIHRRAIERLGIDLPAVNDEDSARIIELAGLSNLRKTVADAFSDLPAEQQEVLRLRIVEERPYREVATTLGISEPTARARASRALRHIADIIEFQTPTEAIP